MTPEVKALSGKLASKEWRMTNLYLIRDKGSRIIPFRPNQAQAKFAKNRHSRNFVPKARQLGMSTYIVIDYLDTCIFPPLDEAGKPIVAECGHIDLTQPNAHKKLAMAKRAWDEGPNHPDPHIATLWRSIHKANPLTRETTGLLQWANGSRQEAGVSFTGSTPFRLHLSEFGPISAQDPSKAAQIMMGPMNAVPMGGRIDVETTMEGGQFGECWQLFELALRSGGSPDTGLDWMLHFVSWLEDSEYDLPGRKPNKAETFAYFAELEQSHGLKVPLSRQAWYEKIKATLSGKVYNQFPTVIEELSRVNIPGQIFPQMSSVRAEGRVCRFNPEKGYPVFTSWDLGSSDNSAGWVIQPAGKAHNVLDWCVGEGQGARGVADVIRAWEEVHGAFSGHLLPHDANITDKGAARPMCSNWSSVAFPATRSSSSRGFLTSGWASMRFAHCFPTAGSMSALTSRSNPRLARSCLEVLGGWRDIARGSIKAPALRGMCRSRITATIPLTLFGPTRRLFQRTLSAPISRSQAWVLRS